MKLICRLLGTLDGGLSDCGTLTVLQKSLSFCKHILSVETDEKIPNIVLRICLQKGQLFCKTVGVPQSERPPSRVPKSL